MPLPFSSAHFGVYMKVDDNLTLTLLRRPVDFEGNEIIENEQLSEEKRSIQYPEPEVVDMNVELGVGSAAKTREKKKTRVLQRFIFSYHVVQRSICHDVAFSSL